MPFFRGLTSKKLFSSASAERWKKEKDCYLKNGSCVLEEFLALCDGNCIIPIRYFSAIEIHNAIKHSKTKMGLADRFMVTRWLGNLPVLVRFDTCFSFFNIHRDIVIIAQMSHLKNVLRLVGCCLEFEEAVMVYQYVEAISLSDLLFRKDNLNRKLLCWGNRLRVAREVASAIVFLHTEFTTPIIHRNIKPSNVIIDEKSGVAKILNFSLSILLPPGELELWGSRRLPRSFTQAETTTMKTMLHKKKKKDKIESIIKKTLEQFFQQGQDKHVITTPPNPDPSGDRLVPDTERDRANTNSRRNTNNNITRSHSSGEEDYREHLYYQDAQNEDTHDPNEDDDSGMSFDSLALHNLDT
uniref:Protein kinase n=1 Tax=Solanum tuberosum TaxID=4113 RepID=M1AV13_SOLTU